MVVYSIQFYLISGEIRFCFRNTSFQERIGFETTDSKENLRDAFTVAASDMAGVMLVFNGKIILGTRARKTRSKSFEAFSSPSGAPPGPPAGYSG